MPERVLVNNNWTPFPPFFTSVDSKDRSSCLESTLPEVLILKGVRWPKSRANCVLILKGLGGTKMSAIYSVRGEQGVLKLDDKFTQKVGYQRNKGLARGILAENLKGAGRGPMCAQAVESEQVKIVCRELDKDTLNMYTCLRAGLGTRELSCIRLDFRTMRANGNGQRIQEEGQQ